MASFMERHSKLLLLMIILAANAAHLATSARLNEDLMMLAKHEKWMARHGRVYKSIKEKEARFKIFKENVKFINEYNQATNGTYKMGLNHFADLTREEFLATYASGYKAPPPSKHLEDYPYTGSFMYENVNVDDLPPSLDWRSKGAVTPVKDQNPCGTCWAFAAVAAIEGINKIKTGNLISLSEQQILDCMGTTCNSGGYTSRAFEYVSSNGGIATESNYPYLAPEVYQEACQAFPAAAQIKGYENVPSYDEVSLLKAVANQPVSVAIDASMLQYYPSGVIPSMPSGGLNHAVTVVGYGTDEYGTKYWLVKNSWGANWNSENGYFRVERDSGQSEGTLGIASQPSYPII